MSSFFIREIELKGGNLEIYQLFEGDVGCVVWDAAITLAKYIDGKHFRMKHNINAKRVLELGAGTGIVGIVAASLGANVTITDLPDFVPLMQKNVEHNAKSNLLQKGQINAEQLKWGEDMDNFQTQFDFILMADLIYYESSIQPLITTMETLASKNTVILMSYEDRSAENKTELQKQFFELAEKYFEMKKIPLEEQDPIYQCEDIHIYEMRKR